MVVDEGVVEVEVTGAQLEDEEREFAFPPASLEIFGDSFGNEEIVFSLPLISSTKDFVLLPFVRAASFLAALFEMLWARSSVSNVVSAVLNWKFSLSNVVK